MFCRSLPEYDAVRIFFLFPHMQRKVNCLISANGRASASEFTVLPAIYQGGTFFSSVKKHPLDLSPVRNVAVGSLVQVSVAAAGVVIPAWL